MTKFSSRVPYFRIPKRASIPEAGYILLFDFRSCSETRTFQCVLLHFAPCSYLLFAWWKSDAPRELLARQRPQCFSSGATLLSVRRDEIGSSPLHPAAKSVMATSSGHQTAPQSIWC